MQVGSVSSWSTGYGDASAAYHVGGRYWVGMAPKTAAPIRVKLAKKRAIAQEGLLMNCLIWVGYSVRAMAVIAPMKAAGARAHGLM